MEESDRELRDTIKRIDWGKFMSFGSIKLQIRDGKPSLVTIEKTVKLD